MRDPLGYVTIGRPNFLHPPFDNKQIRQAAMAALGQESMLATMQGNPEYYNVCGAIFGCATPLGDESRLRDRDGRPQIPKRPSSCSRRRAMTARRSC